MAATPPPGRAARVIALTNWTLYPHMTGVWRLLQEKVFSHLGHRPHFLMDLVDPSSRSKEDILAMLAVLPGFERVGPLTLGLNGNEGNILGRLLGLPENPGDMAGCTRLARDLRQRLGISSVVIHKNKFAVASSPEREAEVEGTYCPKPLKSTGAGDRFNAGYALGLLAGQDLLSCLTFGCASSGFFVRNARSASRSELVRFLEDWGANAL